MVGIALSITMKSYFLEGISAIVAAETALNELLPGQQRPWLLRAVDGGVVAYIDIETHLDGLPNLHVSTDVSGRYYHEDNMVVAALSDVQSRVGGTLKGDV